MLYSELIMEFDASYLLDERSEVSKRELSFLLFFLN